MAKQNVGTLAQNKHCWDPIRQTYRNCGPTVIASMGGTPPGGGGNGGTPRCCIPDTCCIDCRFFDLMRSCLLQAGSLGVFTAFIGTGLTLNTVRFNTLLTATNCYLRNINFANGEITVYNPDTDAEEILTCYSNITLTNQLQALPNYQLLEFSGGTNGCPDITFGWQVVAYPVDAFVETVVFENIKYCLGTGFVDFSEFDTCQLCSGTNAEPCDAESVQLLTPDLISNVWNWNPGQTSNVIDITFVVPFCCFTGWTISAQILDTNFTANELVSDASQGFEDIPVTVLVNTPLASGTYNVTLKATFTCDVGGAVVWNIPLTIRIPSNLP